MVQMTEFTFPSADQKHRIHAVKWVPEGQPRAVLQLIHGIAEYILRYDAFARFMAEHGVYVIGSDHLGHGGSVENDTELGVFAEKDGWDLAVSDIYTLYKETKTLYPDLPYFMLGHSMGSFVLRSFLISYPEAQINGAIISGTGYYAPLVSGAGKWLSEHEIGRKGHVGASTVFQKFSSGPYNKQFKPNRTEFDWLSRDEALVDAYIADPLCGFMPSASMVRDMMGGLGEICRKKNIERMNKEIPVLFIAGDRDPVGSNGKGVQKVYSMFREAGCQDVSIKLYKDGRHEMLNELNKEDVFRDLLEWTTAKL